MKFKIPSSGYAEVDCSNCGGTGMLPWYSYNAFEDARDCDYCDGAGVIFLSPKRMIVSYPGGPFKGSLTDNRYKYKTRSYTK